MIMAYSIFIQFRPRVRTYCERATCTMSKEYRRQRAAMKALMNTVSRVIWYRKTHGR